MHAVSPSNVFTHPRSAPPFDPISLDISSPPTPGSTATPAANPSQELEQLRRRARELELINQFATARVEELEKERALRQRSADGTPTMSPEFVADWESRTEARKRQYCSPNRAGNAREYPGPFGSAPPPHYRPYLSATQNPLTQNGISSLCLA